MIGMLLALAAAAPTPEQMEWLKYNAPDGFDIYPDGIWVRAGADGTGAAYGMRLEDLQPQKGMPSPTIWMRGDHSRDKTAPYRSEKFRVTFNCLGHTYRVGTSIRYKADGSTYSSRYASLYDAFVDVVPGSIGEHWFSLVCP